MKSNSNYFILTLLLLFLTSGVYAQKKQITGKVIDEFGEAIIGAVVMEQGTSNGSITDIDGAYSVEVATGATLTFRSLGFKDTAIKIKDQTIVNVTMEEQGELITELVVVGYGTQKKASITGSISSVNSEDLLKSSSPTLGAALAGKISGLTSIQGSGQPGADDVTMYLRGAATLNGKGPLIMVDGVPREELRVIDPNEIESVSVLKDASATAVFGVRGANGVILITTKRGNVGKPDLNVSVVQSWSSFTTRPAKLSSLEYIRMRNEALTNDGYKPEQLPYQPDVIAKFENPLLGLDSSDPDYAQKAAIRRYMYPNHDYYGEFINEFAPQTRVNINASGGTDKLKYFVNGNYLHQGSNFKHESFDALGFDPSYRNNRFGFRTNLDAQISKSLKAFLNVGSYIETMGMPAQPTYISDWQTMVKHTILVLSSSPPTMPGPTTIDGFGVPEGQTLVPSLIGVTGHELLGRLGFREQTRSSLNATAGFDLDLGKVAKGLSTRTQVSFDYYMNSTTQGNQYLPMYDINLDYDNDTFSYGARRDTQIYLDTWKSATNRYYFNIQYSLNYNTIIDEKHSIGAMALAQRDNWEIDWSAESSDYIPYNMIGLVGRLTYGYDDRYLFEVNAGYNGSEQFSPKKRFGFFPAVSGAWVVSNEKFLADNNTITSLKLRASYGKVGNDKTEGKRFLYQDDMTVGSGGLLGSLGQGNRVNENLIGNPDATWETATKQNYGVDLQLFKSLSFSFDIFKEHRTGILVERGMVPSLQGILSDNLPRVNLGVVDNQGFEMELGYNKAVTKDLTLMFKSNFSYAKNKIVFIDEAAQGEGYPYKYRQTGQSIGQIWGIPIDYSNGNGYFNSQEELDDYLANYATYGVGQPRVGDFKYVDVNEDGTIDIKDQVPMGYSPIPRINYGITLGAKFRNFDANIFFQGVGQVSSYYSGVYAFENNYSGSYFDFHKTAWTAERYAAGEEITYPALSAVSSSNHIANSFFVMDKSYCRLRNVEVGYTLNSGLTKKLGIKNMRFSLNGQNLLLFTNFKMKHVDPELTHQLDYPLSKTVSIGVSANF